MKRKSLQYKLREIAKFGSLRTFSESEAIETYSEMFKDDPDYKAKMEQETRDAYKKGLILCLFEAYPDQENNLEITSVSQRTASLADFVNNIVWFIIHNQ